MELRGWLEEHRAEDVWKARLMGGQREAVFAVGPDASVGTSVEAYGKYRIQNLMIRDAEGGITWLRLTDVLRLYYEDPSLRSKPCSIVTRKESKRCRLEDSISALLSLWGDDDWLDPIILTDCLVSVMGVITAADVLHYLYVYGYQLGCIIKLPASQLDWQPDPPLLLHSSKAIDCLRSLLAPSSPGIVGLVDRRGLLVGNITLADLFPLQDGLELPINVYREGGDPISLLTYGETLSCGDVLRKILQHQVHHVWKLDAFAKPVGILHLRNFITFISKRAGGCMK